MQLSSHFHINYGRIVKNKCLLFWFALLASTEANAWLATLSLGPVWGNPGETQTLYLTPTIEKTYSANRSSQAIPEGELFLGWQHILPYALRGQLGLGIQVTGNAKFSGDIWDDADPEFNNYTYSYNARHVGVVIKGKLLLDRGCWLPWISASIGAGFNKAYAFYNTPKIFEALPNTDFSSRNTTSFTYTLGLGVQVDLHRNWQAGVGYEFSDWGKNRLGRAYTQTLNSGPVVNHLYTNGLMFNLSYLG